MSRQTTIGVAFLLAIALVIANVGCSWTQSVNPTNTEVLHLTNSQSLIFEPDVDFQERNRSEYWYAAFKHTDTNGDQEVNSEEFFESMISPFARNETEARYWNQWYESLDRNNDETVTSTELKWVLSKPGQDVRWAFDFQFADANEDEKLSLEEYWLHLGNLDRHANSLYGGWDYVPDNKQLRKHSTALMTVNVEYFRTLDSIGLVFSGLDNNQDDSLTFAEFTYPLESSNPEEDE